MPKLNPPIPLSELKITKGTYNYGLVKALKPTTRHGKVTSEFLKYQPDLDQGEIGSCTGHAGSYWKNADYWFCTKDLPTAEEMSQFVRDARVMVYNSCQMTYDKFYRTCFSPWFIYKLAQKLGGIAWQKEGAYSIDIARGLSSTGAVPWTECLTPKFGTCAPALYPAPGSNEEEQWNNLVAKAKLHKFEGGFATETDWENAKIAIADSGGRGIILATNLYADYMDLDNDNCFRNHPGGEVVGSHELWCYEVDFDADNGNGIIRFKNSWLKACQYPGMKKDYFQDCAGPAYIAIDSQDAIIGQQKYTKLLITAVDQAGTPVDFTFTIDGEKVIDTHIESGISHLLRATPNLPLNYTESFLLKTVTPTEEQLELPVIFTFTKKATPTPVDIRARIRELIDRIKKKLGLK